MKKYLSFIVIIFLPLFLFSQSSINVNHKVEYKFDTVSNKILINIESNSAITYVINDLIPNIDVIITTKGKFTAIKWEGGNNNISLNNVKFISQYGDFYKCIEKNNYQCSEIYRNDEWIGDCK